MNIELINRGAEGELLLRGRLDAVTSPDAEKIFISVTDRFDRLIFNMSELEYVSSAGLRALRRAQIAMRRKGGALVLKSVKPAVMELFEITGFAATCKFI